MSYTSRYTGPDLTPEERDVADALRHYSDDPVKGATTVDFVPTALLYSAYLLWMAQHHWRYDPEAPARLTPRQFGRAVRRNFPLASRCRRSHSGRQRWGYSGIVGPESLPSMWIVRKLGGAPPGV